MNHAQHCPMRGSYCDKIKVIGRTEIVAEKDVIIV